MPPPAAPDRVIQSACQPGANFPHELFLPHRFVPDNHSELVCLCIHRIALVQYARKLGRFLWMNCHAKRMECVQLAGAVVRRGVVWKREQAGRTLHTLRAVRLPLCHVAPGAIPTRLHPEGAVSATFFRTQLLETFRPQATEFKRCRPKKPFERLGCLFATFRVRGFAPGGSNAPERR
jgi:hypothetical protein